MKRNKIVAAALSIIVCALCLSAPFDSVAVSSTGADVTQVLSDSAVLVSESELQCDFIPVNAPTRAVLKKYTGNGTRIILPETVGGYPLTSYSVSAFDTAKNLEYIKLSAVSGSVTGKHFKEVSALKYIDVDPANPNVTSVDGVLFNKAKTTLLAFPNGVGGSYMIPEGITSIGQSAFYRCAFLAEVIMPNTVEAVYREAFMLCLEMDFVKMSDNLTSIDDMAFANCDDLRSINLPYSLSYIGTDAFLGYISSKNHKVYHFTEGISYVPGTYAEEYVKKMHLPNEVKHLADRKLTDYKTGVTIIDNEKILPNTSKLNLTVRAVPAENYESLLPGTFNKVMCYEISLTNDGAPIPLSKNLLIRFDGLGEDVIPTGTRIFRMNNGELQEYNRTPNAPFVGASAKDFGTYIVASSNDFSMKGDINGDKVISSYDSMFALYLAADLVDSATPEQITAADYNGDGKVTTEDALMILRKAADII